MTLSYLCPYFEAQIINKQMSKMNQLNILPYSKAQFIIIGNLEPVKKDLQKLGGQHCYHLRHPETREKTRGIIFSNKHLNAVTEFLQSKKLVK